MPRGRNERSRRRRAVQCELRGRCTRPPGSSLRATSKEETAAGGALRQVPAPAAAFLPDPPLSSRLSPGNDSGVALKGRNQKKERAHFLFFYRTFIAVRGARRVLARAEKGTVNRRKREKKRCLPAEHCRRAKKPALHGDGSSCNGSGRIAGEATQAAAIEVSLLFIRELRQHRFFFPSQNLENRAMYASMERFVRS